MKKEIYLLLLLSFVLISFATKSYSLNTYVGIKILNLSDDPANSCAGETDYGNQGRIRALSAILPDYPIYFNLTNSSDNSVIWQGNGTEDTDYMIGDTIWLPNQVDLTLGNAYDLMFDIDVIRVFLKLQSNAYFSTTADSNYWIKGNYVSINRYQGSDSETTCQPGSSASGSNRGNICISNNRSNSFSTVSECVILAYPSTGYDYNINSKYTNLYESDVGNFHTSFTFN